MTDKLIPYLLLDGNAGEAIKFYEDVFETTAEITYFKEWPDAFDGNVPDEIKDKVMHAELNTPAFSLYFSDRFDASIPYQIGNNISLCIYVATPEVSKNYYDKLSVDGEIITPYGPTPYSSGYSQFLDKYGNEWQIISDMVEE